MKKINNKKEKGITLIALVITIIVLLILAGVSIAMLTGQNGILTQAQKAKTTTENKNAEEKVKIAVMAARSQSDTAALDANKLKEEIENQGGTAETTVIGFPVTATIDGKSFTIDASGNVEFEGKIGPGTVISLTSTSNTTEEFYILSYDENTKKAKALAKYNLKVGTNYKGNTKINDIDTTEPGYGLQDSNMGGYITGHQQNNGTLAFSNSKYWDDTYTPQGKNPWVYNNKSNLYKYVELYKSLLGNNGKVSEVSLASYEDINALWSNQSNRTWLCSTSYWLGSAYSSDAKSIWTIFNGGFRFAAISSCNEETSYRSSPSYNC